MSGANVGSERWYARFSVNSALAAILLSVSPRRWALGTALAGLISLSCGSGHATLQLSLPPSVVAGAPFTATVTAFYNG